jgi:uncharacterized protein (TIGR02271 family)
LLAGLLVLLAAIYFLAFPLGRRKRSILLRQEELHVRKTREQLADVTTHKEVSRETKTVTVPVTREELVVEKDGVEAARIPLCEEQVDVSTHVVPLNEVSVQQREWTENRTVQAVLKKEVARVETTGDAPYTDITTEKPS